MISLKTGKTMTEIQRHSKEMIVELVRHQGDFTEVKGLTEYLTKIRILE